MALNACGRKTGSVRKDKIERGLLTIEILTGTRSRNHLEGSDVYDLHDTTAKYAQKQNYESLKGCIDNLARILKIRNYYNRKIIITTQKISRLKNIQVGTLIS